MNTFDDINYDVALPHQNRIQAVVWDFDLMRHKLLREVKKRGLNGPQTLTIALRLSVDSTNLDRFTPIPLTEDRVFTNEDARDMFSGDANKPDTLTVNRFCACMSTEISKYLDKHPDEIWGQKAIEGVSPCFAFPHSYYLPNLTYQNREEILLFLYYMDSIMSKALKRWNPISHKAAFYWKHKYGDKPKIKGNLLEVEFNKSQ
jgi:hypothetical protein